MPLSIKYDYRFDPFTKADSAIDISSEEQVVPSNTPYYISMEEVPREDSPSLITAYDVTDGLTLSEVSGVPASGEFDVDYEYQTGKIRFNSAQAGNTIRFDYKGTGHVIAGTFINILSDWLGKDYTVGNNHDHNDVNSKRIDTSLGIPRMLISDVCVSSAADYWTVTMASAATYYEFSENYKVYLPAKTTSVEFYIYFDDVYDQTPYLTLKVEIGGTDIAEITGSGHSGPVWVTGTITTTVNAAAAGWYDVKLYAKSPSWTGEEARIHRVMMTLK